MIRSAKAALLAASFLGFSVFASAAYAQPASDCGQLANVAGLTDFTFEERGGRNDSAAILSGLINAAVQNALDDVNVAGSVPVAANLSVVCVSDSLNGNHLEILKNIDVDVIDDVTVAGNQVLNNVDVLAVDGTTIYVAPTNLNIGGPAAR